MLIALLHRYSGNTSQQLRDRTMTSLTHPNTLARRAGLLYLLLIPLGFFGLLYVPTVLMVANDPATTYLNLQTHELSFRLSILAALCIQIIQLFIALALYDLFKTVNKRWAQLIVLFTLAAMPIALLNELSRVALLHLLNDNAFTAALSTETLHRAVQFLLTLNDDGVMIAHIFWGFWLLPMGVLILKSGYVPAFIGWLMILAFGGYVADTFAWLLIPNETYDFALFTFWGEIILPLWLVFKGVKTHS